MHSSPLLLSKHPKMLRCRLCGARVPRSFGSTRGMCVIVLLAISNRGLLRKPQAEEWPEPPHSSTAQPLLQSSASIIKDLLTERPKLSFGRRPRRVPFRLARSQPAPHVRDSQLHSHHKRTMEANADPSTWICLGNDGKCGTRLSLETTRGSRTGDLTVCIASLNSCGS